MSTPALTVAVVAGVAAGRAVSYLVGLTVEGQCTFEFLTRSTAFAPDACLADLQLVAATSDEAPSVDHAVSDAIDAIRHSATVRPDMVSLDVDVARTCPGVPAKIDTVRYQPQQIPPGI